MSSGSPQNSKLCASHLLTFQPLGVQPSSVVHLQDLPVHLVSRSKKTKITATTVHAWSLCHQPSNMTSKLQKETPLSTTYSMRTSSDRIRKTTLRWGGFTLYFGAPTI